MSVIPFQGVTEAMMWHVLWVFYTNGRDELLGQNPYAMDSYWKGKFEEPAVKFLFREKLPSLSISESNSLLDSFGNMARSRTADEKEFTVIVTNEMMELSFMISQKNKGDSMSRKCTEIFSELAMIHPFLISSLISKIKSSPSRNESIIECLSEIPFDIWTPTNEDMAILTEWLVNTSVNHFSNRLSRVILSKINWGCHRHEKHKLHMDLYHHRSLAIQLYAAAKMHVYVDTSEDPFCTRSFSGFDGKATLELAKSPKPIEFIEWCWRILLSLRLHLLEQPFIPSSWDPEYYDSFAYTRPLPSGFANNIPNVDTDTGLLPISKGLQTQNPFASYITLSMTERGHRPDFAESNVDLLIQLIISKNFIQSLSILSWFIPLNIDSLETVMIKNRKFVSAFNSLLVSDVNNLLDRILGMIKQQLEAHHENRIKIITFWADILHEVATLVVKTWSKSWFVVSNKGLSQVVFLLDSLVQITCRDDALQTKLLESFMGRPFDEVFAKQMSTSGLLSFSWVPFTNNNPLKKCDWITPLHVMQQKFPDKTWLSWIIIKGDMIKMDDIWHDSMAELNANYEVPTEVVIKNVCQRHNRPAIPVDLIPMNSWAKLILDTSFEHPLLPLMCFNFFKCFFSSTDTEGSLGHRFLSENLATPLKSKMSSMADYHHKEWLASSENSDLNHHHSNCTKLYRAFLVWIEDGHDAHLHDPYVDFNHLPVHFCTEVLKQCMDGGHERGVTVYVNYRACVQREWQLLSSWIEIKEFDANVHVPSQSVQPTLFELENDVIQPCPEPTHLRSHEDNYITLPDESAVPEGSGCAMIGLLRHIIRGVMEEGRLFSSHLNRFSLLNRQYTGLLPDMYKNVSKEITLKGACDKDNYDLDGCGGAATVTVSINEATENPQVVKELDRNRNDYNKVLIELVESPSDKVVSSVILTEAFISILFKSSRVEDRVVISDLLGYLLSWIPDSSLVFPPSKHLFDSLLERIPMETEEDRDRSCLFLLEMAFSYPHLVQYFAPRVVPNLCSINVFLHMYSRIQDKMMGLPPMASFVLLSKFDVGSWLKRADDSSIIAFDGVLGQAFNILSPTPPEDKLMILGLFQKHRELFQRFNGLLIKS